MHSTATPPQCHDCPAQYVCRCLRITEETIKSVLTVHSVQTIQELRSLTGAGDGCTCCHSELEQMIAGRDRRQRMDDLHRPAIMPSRASLPMLSSGT